MTPRFSLKVRPNAADFLVRSPLLLPTEPIGIQRIHLERALRSALGWFVEARHSNSDANLRGSEDFSGSGMCLMEREEDRGDLDKNRP